MEGARAIGTTARFAYLCRLVVSLVLHALAAVAVVAGGCDSSVATLSPDNLSVEVRSDLPIYAPRDNFSGSFTFINRSAQRLRAAFPTTGLYHVDFYDAAGNLRRGYFPVKDSVVTYLELAPLSTRTDSFKLPLYSPPESLVAGACRIHAWVEGHPDIYSEAAIQIR